MTQPIESRTIESRTIEAQPVEPQPVETRPIQRTAPTPEPQPPGGAGVRVPYRDLVAFVSDVLAAKGLPDVRAHAAAEALCHGDLTGFTSHGIANLTRLYLPMLEAGRCDPRAEPETVTDHGASVLLDARRALGLWAAGEAMDLAVERAGLYGVGMVSVRGGTHFGCAGHHALRAVRHRMVGLVTANCGSQQIARPVGGRAPMLGTNPLALAAPAGEHPPFVLDMSTTTVPTGKVREAARAGRSVPAGWLADEHGAPVVDPAAFDRGDAHLRWLGGEPDTGAYKGFGLGLLVEVLSALVPGAALGPHVESGRAAAGPRQHDDGIGYLTLAIDPGRLRAGDPAGRPGAGADFLADATGMFGALLGCPPVRAGNPVRYPGWPEDSRSRERRANGVPITAALHQEMLGLARSSHLRFPAPAGSAQEAQETQDVQKSQEGGPA